MIQFLHKQKLNNNHLRKRVNHQLKNEKEKQRRY